MRGTSACPLTIETSESTRQTCHEREKTMTKRINEKIRQQWLRLRLKRVQRMHEVFHFYLPF